MKRALVLATVLAGCAPSDEPVVIELSDTSRSFEVDGDRELRIVGDGVGEAWVDGGTFAGEPVAQWAVPRMITGERALTVLADGDVSVQVWARGDEPPVANRARSTTWLDAALLDDASTISFARVMSAIADDGHGGPLLDRWFRAFAAGPGAGRATFAQFLATQSGAPTTWDLGAMPFKVTGVHNRQDLAHGDDCGELRVSIASTHPTLAPLHILFIFRQAPQDDDITPDGAVHCRGTSRRWAHLVSLDATGFASAARDTLDRALTRAHFEMAESVELTLSPWQWRQWIPDGAGGLANPPLFQTIDVPRVNTPGATRDAFLAAVAANADAIAARTWTVPAMFRATVAEVQPTDIATLPDAGEHSRALGMIGCPRCHTDNADFIQTSVDRVPSPFYDKELDARAARIDALARGEWPPAAPFGPLQPD